MRPAWVLPPTGKPILSFTDEPAEPCPDPSLPYVWADGQWRLLTVGPPLALQEDWAKFDAERAGHVPVSFDPTALPWRTGIEAEHAHVDPGVTKALDRVRALGIEVHDPGPDSVMDAKEAGSVADTFEQAFKQYPVLNAPNSPLPLKKLQFATGTDPESRDTAGRLPDTAGAAVSTNIDKPYSWMTFNDRPTRVSLKDADPGLLSVGTLGDGTYKGIAWHEMGHAIAYASGYDHKPTGRFQGNGDVVDLLVKHHVTPQDMATLGNYAASSPEEALGEMSAMWNNPGYRDKLAPELRVKVQGIFEDMSTLHAPGEARYDG